MMVAEPGMTEAELRNLGERIAETAAHLDAAMHRLLADLRKFDAEGGWYRAGARTCAQWLSWRVGWEMGTAREHVRVARALGTLPLVDDALRRGAISYCKVRAITRVATADSERLLLEYARLLTGQQLERVCRQYATIKRLTQGTTPRDDASRRYLRKQELACGLVKIEVVLHPEEAALVWQTIERAAKQMNDPDVPAETPAVAAPRALAGADPDVPAGTPAPSLSTEMALEPELLRRFEAEPELDVLAETRADPDVPAETRRAPSLATGSASAPRSSAGSTASCPGKPRFDRVDGFMALVQRAASGSATRTPIELVVSLPAAALTRPPHDAIAPERVDPTLDSGCLPDGTCLPPETLRRLACDAGVVAVVEGEHGEPLSVGRKMRTVPSAIKRALVRRDRCCRFPGCTNTLWVEAHHIEHWANGGETSLRNTVLLCSLCRARHNEHYADYLVMPRSSPVSDGDVLSYAA